MVGRGQTIAANNHLRPRTLEITAKFADRFPKVDFFSVEKTFGDWRSVQKTHFIDGGVFDQIYSPTDPSPLDEKPEALALPAFHSACSSATAASAKLVLHLGPEAHRCPPASKNSISRRMPALSRQPGRSRTISSSR